MLDMLICCCSNNYPWSNPVFFNFYFISFVVGNVSIQSEFLVTRSSSTKVKIGKSDPWWRKIIIIWCSVIHPHKENACHLCWIFQFVPTPDFWITYFLHPTIDSKIIFVLYNFTHLSYGSILVSQMRQILGIKIFDIHIVYLILLNETLNKRGDEFPYQML